MTKSVVSAYAALQARLATVSGLRATPVYPVERPPVFPYLEMDPVSGKWTNFTHAGQPSGEHSFKWKIHVGRAQGLPRAAEELLPFADRVAPALMYDNYQLGGTVDSIVSLSYTEKAGAVADVDTLCYDFELVVKIMGLG